MRDQRALLVEASFSLHPVIFDIVTCPQDDQLLQASLQAVLQGVVHVAASDNQKTLYTWEFSVTGVDKEAHKAVNQWV
jgi:hypothetical protein